MASETRTNAGRPLEANGRHLSTCGYADMPPRSALSAEKAAWSIGANVDVPAVAEMAVSDVSDSEVAVPALAGTILRNFSIRVFIVRQTHIGHFFCIQQFEEVTELRYANR